MTARASIIQKAIDMRGTYKACKRAPSRKEGDYGQKECRVDKRSPGLKRLPGGQKCTRKERWRRVVMGSQVVGKASSGWEGDTYPVDAIAKKGPPLTKRKLSSQDSNSQPGEPRIAQRALIIQKVN